MRKTISIPKSLAIKNEIPIPQNWQITKMCYSLKNGELHINLYLKISFLRTLIVYYQNHKKRIICLFIMKSIISFMILKYFGVI